MTVYGLVSALIVGLVVGLAGRLAVPGRRDVPIWLTAAVGVVAALLGTVVARLAGVDLDGFHPLRLVVQIGLSVIAVVVVTATAGRDGADHARTPASPLGSARAEAGHDGGRRKETA